MYLAR